MDIFETQLLAERVAKDLFLSNQSLNSGIAKIATERDLSRVEIQQLAGATNHAANEHFRKTAADKTYTFGLADLDEILVLLDPVEKTAGQVMHKVASAVQSLSPHQEDFDHLFKLAEIGSDAEQERRRKEARYSFAKLAELLEDTRKTFEARKLSELDKIAEELPKLEQVVTEYLVQKHAEFKDICRYAVDVIPEAKITAPVMLKVAGNLEKLGHAYTGQLAEGKELLAETFKRSGTSVPEPNVTVVNGNTPIQRSLKIIHQASESVQNYDNLTHEVASLSSVLCEKETALNSNEAVSKYITEDLDSAYRAATAEQDPIKKIALVVPALKAATGLVTKAVTSPLARKGAKMAVKEAPKAIAGAAATTAMGAALKGGSAVANKARQGVAQSAGTGAADSSTKRLS